MVKKKSYVATALVFLLLAVPAQAGDIRGEAMAMLAKLREEGVAARFPEELRSLDATVATAEMYYQLNDLPNAERYYRLATQKGTLLQERLKGPATASTSPSPAESVSTPPAQPTQQPAAPKPPTAEPQPAEPEPEQSATAHSDENLQLVQSEKLVGTIGTYTVVKNDTLQLVAGKLGVSRAQLMAMNGLTPKSVLKEGQVLRYNNQRIIPPSPIKNGLLINIPDRMLYYFQNGKVTYATPVALGTPTKMDNIPWHTPTGRFRIIDKAKDPVWTVPPSIQEEMRREGREVITSIPPGPDNPLGKYAMKTSLPGILIHSTIKPWSIYTYASHGCIRVYPDRMEELFKMVKLHTPGEIIYRPVKAAVTEEGRIFLEVHGDIYAKTKGLEKEARAILNAMRLGDKVDWKKVHQVISRKSGVAEEITLDSIEAQQQPVVKRGQSPS